MLEHLLLHRVIRKLLEFVLNCNCGNKCFQTSEKILESEIYCLSFMFIELTLYNVTGEFILTRKFIPPKFYLLSI